MTSATKYLYPGFNMMLFQCILELVWSDDGVETGPSNLILSPNTVSLTLYIYFFWGQMSHTIRLYVILVPWGDFSVDEKKVVVPLMSPIPWKRRLISLDTPLIHFSLLGPFMRFRYYWAFTVLRHITALTMPGFRLRVMFALSITAQYSLYGRMRVDSLLGTVAGVLMVAIWFSMRCCPCRQLMQVL